MFSKLFVLTLTDIEILDLGIESLQILARKTRVLINAIGPYSIHGAPVLEACASAGTHYLDFSTETPWIREMIVKFHDIAEQNSSRAGSSDVASTRSGLTAALDYSSHW
jgi:short subunit dehydrogenase-like uncharacterized protein